MSQMSQPKHTELPWEQDNYVIRHGRIDVCRCDDTENSLATDAANAEFIVRSANSHYALVEALEEAIKDLVCTRNSARHAAKDDARWEGVGDVLENRIIACRTVLKQAKGES